MKPVTMVMVALLGMASGWAFAGDALKLPTPVQISDMAKSSAAGAANAALSKPCSAGKPTEGKAASALCNEVAGQLASGLANQTAPSAKNLGVMARDMATDTASATLSKQCSAGTPTYGKTGNDICNEVAGQLAASIANQTAPSAKNVGAIAKVAAVGVAGDTLSRPCVVGTTEAGKAASAACKVVAGQLAASLGSQTAPNAKKMTAGVHAVASNALAVSAGQKISQALTGSQQPLVGDLLTLGLKRHLPAGYDGIGTFAPPGNSALPIGTAGLRSGVSILSTDQGKAGLGVKSSLEIGSKKFEISGSLDPNSSSDQGKSAGVQIKIGGD